MRRALESLEFVEACAAGRLEDVRHFLGRGVSVNATKEHLTGLHQACYHGHTDVMEHLLQQPSLDVDMRGRNNVTALQIACLHLQLPVCERLVQAGASVNARDDDGYSPLVFAMMSSVLQSEDADAAAGAAGSRAKVAFLLSLPHVDLEAIDSFGLSIPQLARRHGLVEFADMVTDEAAGRLRWSVARAAWCAVVAQATAVRAAQAGTRAPCRPCGAP